MKRLLIGVFAFALTLGVACKKEEVLTLKTEKVKPVVKAEFGGDTWPIGTNPFGLPDLHKGIDKKKAHAAIYHVCTGLTEAEMDSHVLLECIPY